MTDSLRAVFYHFSDLTIVSCASVSRFIHFKQESHLRISNLNLQLFCNYTTTNIVEATMTTYVKFCKQIV